MECQCNLHIVCAQIANNTGTRQIVAGCLECLFTNHVQFHCRSQAVTSASSCLQNIFAAGLDLERNLVLDIRGLTIKLTTCILSPLRMICISRQIENPYDQRETLWACSSNSNQSNQELDSNNVSESSFFLSPVHSSEVGDIYKLRFLFFLAYTGTTSA